MFILCDELETPPWDTLPEGVSFLAYQLEKSPSNGALHYQGYIELPVPKPMTWLHKNLHPGLQLKKRFGTQQQAIEYVTKDATRVEGPWEFGKPRDAKGSRSDLVRIRDMIRNGATRRDLIEDMPGTYARYHRFVNLVFKYTKPAKRDPIAIFLCYGATGTGKSRWVDDLYDPDDLYIVPLTERKQWYDGYDSEPNVLLDDFSGKLPRDSLLRLLQHYRLRVPEKGGFVWWRPDRIYITTNLHPRQWYQDWTDFEEHYRALERRVTTVYDFTRGTTFESRLVDKATWFAWGKRYYTRVSNPTLTEYAGPNAKITYHGTLGAPSPETETMSYDTFALFGHQTAEEGSSSGPMPPTVGE